MKKLCPPPLNISIGKTLFTKKGRRKSRVRFSKKYCESSTESEGEHTKKLDSGKKVKKRRMEKAQKKEKIVVGKDCKRKSLEQVVDTIKANVEVQKKREYEECHQGEK